uniref:Uncharacterized protein n=1 Tax=Leersia perrieri TaxID=77586 RepID=A0A0D9XWP3_9ORYZ
MAEPQPQARGTGRYLIDAGNGEGRRRVLDSRGRKHLGAAAAAGELGKTVACICPPDEYCTTSSPNTQQCNISRHQIISEQSVSDQ